MQNKLHCKVAARKSEEIHDVGTDADRGGLSMLPHEVVEGEDGSRDIQWRIKDIGKIVDRRVELEAMGHRYALFLIWGRHRSLLGRSASSEDARHHAEENAPTSAFACALHAQW